MSYLGLKGNCGQAFDYDGDIKWNRNLEHKAVVVSTGQLHGKSLPF